MFSFHLSADDIKPCPRCAAYIIKMNDGSCNHMTCAVCGCEFCWLCMKEISDLHYLRSVSQHAHTQIFTHTVKVVFEDMQSPT